MKRANVPRGSCVNRASAGTRLGFETLEDRRLLSVTPERLTALDYRPNSSDPTDFTQVGSTFFFSANDATVGRALWKTDLTEAGTVRVKDISPGLLTELNGTLFFIHNNDLWKSDGTEAGTVVVKDLPASVGGVSFGEMVNANGTIFFMFGSDASGRELWKSDGTEAGTMQVKDIRPGDDDSRPQFFSSVGSTLFFTANDGTNGEELWKSDGTEAGTMLVKDINPGAADGVDSRAVNVNGTLYFRANDGTHGSELWKTDGTEAGTVMVKDIYPGSLGASPGLANADGTLMFSASDGVTGGELWTSDGTEAGTVLVEDINPGPSHSDPRSFMVAGGVLFFVANDGTSGRELWRSDGTQLGTVLIKDINPGSGDSSPALLADVNGALFLRATDGTGGGTPNGIDKLWKSDGTELGTVWISDVFVKTSPLFSINANGKLLFEGNDRIHGDELWSSDGTTDGTTTLKEIFPGITSSGGDGINPTEFVNANGTPFFLAETHPTFRELWASDGTTAGTALVKDINPGQKNSYPFDFTPVGDTLFFIARDGQGHDYELWKSDGTEAGTIMVKDTNPIPASAYGYPPPPIGDLENVGGTLFFRANDSTNGYELWKSDGTEAGTTMLKDLAPGAPSGHPQELTNVDGTLYFTSGGLLWKSDGTEAGTIAVAGALQASQLQNVNGTLYFRGNDGGGQGHELWRADDSGTSLVKNIWPGAGSSYPANLTNVNGVLFFRANDFTHNVELWKSDGTEAGTMLVKDIDVGSSATQLHDFTNVNGTLFFNAQPDLTQQLWKSDGTEAGTILLRDFGTGIENRPVELTAVDAALFFRANETVDDGRLWRSDGTVAGTEVVSQLLTDVTGLANVDGTLYFGAEDGITGNQAWVVRPPAVTGRHVFYNQSAFDLNSPGIHVADATAIDVSKTAYLPGGGTITSASVTSYVHGINGIFVDALDLAGTPILDDFTFRVSQPGAGANNTPSTWTAAPAPTAFTVLADTPTPGTQRVEFIWATGAIANRYLEVTVEGNDAAGGFNTNTGLAASDVFYFGNIIGDTFNDASPTTFLTTASDEIEIQPHVVSTASVTSPYDLDRNGVHLASDRIVARGNTIFALNRISISSPPAAPVPLAGSSASSAVASALTIPDSPDSRAATTVEASRPTSSGGQTGPLAAAWAQPAGDAGSRVRAILTLADEPAASSDLDDDLLDSLLADLSPK